MFRKINEGFAVKQAARLATDEQIRKLEKIYVNLLKAAKKKDTQSYVQVGFSLHDTIWRIVANEYLEEPPKRVLLPIFAFTVIRVISRPPFDFVKDAASHLPLLEAIKSRNPDRAHQAFCKALNGWLTRIRESVFASLGTEEPKRLKKV